MELILRDDDGNEVNLGVNPEELEGTCEAGAHTLYYALVKSIDTLEGIQNYQDKNLAEKEMEKEERAVERERAQDNSLWKQDPGIDSPEDYV
jgi:hypothetical protein